MLGYIHLQNKEKQMWSKPSHLVGWCRQLEWHGGVPSAMITERVACRCWWQSPKGRGQSWSQDRLACLLFSSTATSLNTKGVWLLSAKEIVWLFCDGRCSSLLSVFITHSLWLSKKDLLFKIRANCGKKLLSLLRSPAAYQEKSDATVRLEKKILCLKSLTGEYHIVWH